MSGRGHNAFTLVEVLVSLALLAVLSGVLLGFGAGLSERRARVQRVSEVQGGLDMVFHAIDHALTAADANAGGVSVSASGVSITSRAITTGERTEEFGTLSVSFDAGTRELTLENSRLGGRRVVAGVERAEFRAETGSGWGAYSGSGLPRAVEVSVWLSSEGPVEAAEADPLEEPTFDLGDELLEDQPVTLPDRWRVFPLVDVLGEVGP